MKRFFYAASLLSLLLIAFIWQLSRPRGEAVSASISLQEALSSGGSEFAEVRPGRTFSFPADHGPHPDYKTEWWYFTGNLQDGAGRGFGYELTLFRIGVHSRHGTNPSEWNADSLMMGHLAVSNPLESQFYQEERFSRAADGLAGFLADAKMIWLEDWTVERQAGGWTLKARTGNKPEVVLQLHLKDTKPPVLEGDGGYSRKGPFPQHASYYVSQTRLETAGNLTIGESSYAVEGVSWFDHEWSSEPLAKELVGWDWFSLQLSDNTEIMIYLLRSKDGTVQPWSSGSYIDSTGTKTEIKQQDFQLVATSNHLSPSGRTYPSQWRLVLPKQGLNLEIAPTMLDQELHTRVVYWEGAVSISGEKNGRPLDGEGFVELTGYGPDEGSPDK